MKERKRNVDIHLIQEENLEEVSNSIGEKVRSIVDAAIIEANKILNIYGMEAKMEIAITEKEKKEE